MKRRLKRFLIGFFLSFAVLILLLSLFYRISALDSAVFVYAKLSPVFGYDIQHKPWGEPRVINIDSGEVVRKNAPVRLTYAELLLKFVGEDPVQLAIDDFKRGEAKSIEMRVAYTDMLDARHPIGTVCGTVRKRYWMYYSGIIGVYGPSMSFRVAQKVRHYNLAITLLPMFQEHNAFYQDRYNQARLRAVGTKHESYYSEDTDYRKADCVTLYPSEPRSWSAVNGTSFAIERKMIATPVDYEAMRHRVIGLLDLTEKEYEAEKEKYYGMNALYEAINRGDLAFLKSYEGDLTRPNVAGEKPVQIAFRYARKQENPEHPVYIYLLQKTQDPDHIFAAAKKHGFGFLRRNNIPFDEAALREEMQAAAQRRLEHAQRRLDELR